MNNNWYYLDKLGNAGLPARPPRIKDLGQHSIEIFVRELIQNSLDARLSDESPVAVKFKIEEWNKNEINNFLELLGKEHFEKFSQSYSPKDVPADVKAKDESRSSVDSGN